jgi:hypothetical protein
VIGDAPGQRAKLHTQDRRATGNPVYNGASNAATMGTVDPSGYVDRERRSRLAKSILTAGGIGGGNAVATPGVDPTQLVGETAASIPQHEIIRMLAARMQRRKPRG